MITMTIFEMILRSVLIFLSILIPGYLVSLALFKRTEKFSFLEMLLLGIPFGMFLPSILAIIEFDLGISYSPILALANVLLITIIAAVYVAKNNIEIIPSKSDKKESQSKETLLYSILLIITLFFAWWLRIQSLTPYYYDFDPYWYNHATEFIIKQGSIPAHDDYVWYPNPDSHRTFPFIPYMEATWYHLFTLTNGIQGFNFELMTMVSGLYPPLIAMLTVFFAYLWLSREYGKRIGILAAVLLAFTPVYLQKTGAGSFEFTPFGVFGIISFAALLALTLKYKSKEIAIAAGFILALSAFGSGSSLITPLLLTVTIGWFTLSSFFRGKEMKEIIQLIIPMIVITLVAFIILVPYYLPINGINSLPLVPLLIVLGAGMIAYILDYLSSITVTFEDKLLFTSSLIVAGLVLLTLTPAKIILDSVLGTIGYVATNLDVTMKTIAEQTVAPSDFYGALGVLGWNISISITPIIIALAIIALLIKFGDQVINKETSVYNEASIVIALAGTVPFAVAGLLKAKYVFFMGAVVPLLFMFLIGELTKIKMKYLSQGILLIVSIIAFLQFVQYSDAIIKSIGLSSVDVVDNSNYMSKICTPMQDDITNVSKSNSLFRDDIAEMKIKTYSIYCSRIPEWWLEPMLWIRENVNGSEDRIMSWWDYGHWINTIGQSKSVTGNTHSYTIMHQEVADKIVGSDPQKLIEYMKEHKAKYLLLDQDLIGKWGALVYHYCNYNNETTVDKQPGESLCDHLASPEYIYIPLNPTSTQYCNLKTDSGQRAIKVYSSFGDIYGFDHYCLTGSSLPLYYENKTAVGINNILAQGSQDNVLIAIATYKSDNLDKKGRFYDSIFYKGFFEGNIPGMTQVYPNVYSNQPNLPVRIYKINE